MQTQHSTYMPTLQIIQAGNAWLKKSREQRFRELGDARGNSVHCAGCYYSWQGDCMATTDNLSECTAILGATK